jgi:hypothetical protein
MNNLFKFETALINACSKYAKTRGTLNDQQDGFRLQRNIHDALASLLMMMEDTKIYNKDIYIMYANFKGAAYLPNVERRSNVP